jgi:hypothetical protein
MAFWLANIKLCFILMSVGAPGSQASAALGMALLAGPYQAVVIIIALDVTSAPRTIRPAPPRYGPSGWYISKLCDRHHLMSVSAPGNQASATSIGMSGWPTSKLCDNIALMSAFPQPTIASATSVGPFARAGSGALISIDHFSRQQLPLSWSVPPQMALRAAPLRHGVLPGCFTIGSAPPLSAAVPPRK